MLPTCRGPHFNNTNESTTLLSHQYLVPAASAVDHWLMVSISKEFAYAFGGVEGSHELAEDLPDQAADGFFLARAHFPDDNHCPGPVCVSGMLR